MNHDFRTFLVLQKLKTLTPEGSFMTKKKTLRNINTKKQDCETREISSTKIVQIHLERISRFCRSGIPWHKCFPFRCGLNAANNFNNIIFSFSISMFVLISPLFVEVVSSLSPIFSAVFPSSLNLSSPLIVLSLYLCSDHKLLRRNFLTLL